MKSQKRMELTDLGADELMGYYGGFRFFWNPKTKLFRIWGQSVKDSLKVERADLLSHVKRMSKQ